MKHTKILVMLFICFNALLLLENPVKLAHAGETVTTMNSSSVQFSTNELHRVGSKIVFNAAPTMADIDACDGSDPDITCPAAGFSPSNVQVEYECKGYSSAYPNGGWSLENVTADQCWSALRVCYYEGTPSEVCVDVGPQDLGAPNNQKMVHDDTCTPGAPGAKDYCSINYSGPTRVPNGPNAITGNTGDDMFKIPPVLPKSQGFFSYKRISDPDYELRYVIRNAGSARDDKDLMLPSGPFTDFADFKNFMDSPPSFLTVEGGCYPIDIKLCEGTVPPPPAPSGCVLGPLVEVTSPSMPWPSGIKTWDGWAGNMSSPGPGNLCQGANYVTSSAGGNEVFNNYGGNCGSMIAGDFSPIGKCIDRVEANCGNNLSCASNCSVLVRNCTTGSAPMPGNCGSANGTSTSTMPASNLCNATGIAPTVVDNGTTWDWTCTGQNGGGDDTCSAPKTTACGTVTGYSPSAETDGVDCATRERFFPSGNLLIPYCRGNYTGVGDQVTNATDIANGNCAIEGLSSTGGIKVGSCVWKDVTIMSGGSACP